MTHYSVRRAEQCQARSTAPPRGACGSLGMAHSDARDRGLSDPVVRGTAARPASIPLATGRLPRRTCRRLSIVENEGHAELGHPIASTPASFLSCTIGGIQGEENDSHVLVGSRIVTAAPCPGPSLATAIVPACASTMERAMANPRPVPPTPRRRDWSLR